MGIKIIYMDTGSNEVLRETILDDVDVEAFEYVTVNTMDWIDNCFQNRVRQAIDEICEKSLASDNSEVVLSVTDKKAIVSKAGLVARARELPVNIKKDIVKKATFDSAKIRSQKIIKQTL
tara:strand:- start:205 stop:564 length:360 start_codon:yes stop_codon:yes gene_type:complete